jgi:cobalt/nickel transport system permease protein
MHMADGLVNLPINGAAWVASGTVCAVALRHANATLGDKHPPLLGMTGAFIFAAQMLNFPVLPGVSGHFMGGALAVLLLGPLNAVLVMALVVGVQCLLFADGGLSVLGVNILNLAVVGPLAAHLAFRLLRRAAYGGRAAFLACAAVSAWLSVVAAALVCGLQLLASGTLPWSGVGLLVAVHVPIGLGEALVTFGALSVILGARPDLVAAWPPAEVSADAACEGVL